MFPEVKVAVRSIILNNGYADIYLLRFVKPFDEEYFIKLSKKYDGIVFVEDGVITGGISEYINSILFKHKYFNTKILAFEDKFFEHGNRSEILEDAGLSSVHIEKAVKEVLHA